MKIEKKIKNLQVLRKLIEINYIKILDLMHIGLLIVPLMCNLFQIYFNHHFKFKAKGQFCLQIVYLILQKISMKLSLFRKVLDKRVRSRKKSTNGFLKKPQKGINIKMWPDFLLGWLERMRKNILMKYLIKLLQK